VSFAGVGATFVFGPLADGNAFGKMASVIGPGASGVIIAFQVLPIIIFVAALMAVLYHFGVMQVVVRAVCSGHAPPDAGERRRIAQHCGERVSQHDGSALTIRPYLPELTNPS
jgi:CNT family concentrative nucleoside transporter